TTKRIGKSILEKTLTRWPVFVDHFTSTLRARRAKAHKGESLHPDGKQALPCCRSRYIVHNVWVFNAYWVTTGRIFEYHWRCQPV
ncbi:hypothetical protein, partial [Escherichia coli]|uniref:hypothetical protein n=1 Tax=Escherichia coli TaxID=562 RepID=UPI00203C01D5